MKCLAYWWKDIPNFGDRLTPLLLSHFSDINCDWSPIQKANLVGVGSIVEHIPESWVGFVVGSGKMYAESKFPGVERKRILGLRGPLTAKGIRGNFALGDPGLLANELVQVETKKYDLGIVPHWSDTELAKNPLFAKYNPIVIDPRADPLDVIRTIGECKKIVASSLHGIIIADSFSIPRRFEYTKRFDTEGGIFKFQDYSAALNTPFEAGKLIAATPRHLEDRKHELFDMFYELGTQYA